MRLFIDGVDLRSSSGPNSFARKLFDSLVDQGHSVTFNIDPSFWAPEVRLTFIQGSEVSIPTALRLDGIYFNTRQNWQEMNVGIRRSYDRADMIIHQTDFDKRLIEHYFGAHPRSVVIRNGADTRKTMDAIPLKHPALDGYTQTWVCASSWRPHKRLNENIRYFRENAGENDCLVVAGKVDTVAETLQGLDMSRVFLAGDLNQDQLLSLYKRSTHLIHLAWLDHCPNVVVDARAAGCRIVCSSSGGTEEIAGTDAIVIEEDVWDLSPLDLYRPPRLDFSRRRSGKFDHLNDMRDVAQKYAVNLGDLLR